MSLAFDESGRPFIVLREQEKKQRVKGLDAHKVRTQSLTTYSDEHHGSKNRSQPHENISWT